MGAPPSDSIIVSVARLVDDAQTETREPSHSDIEFQIGRVRLTLGDPKAQSQLVGKAKRVRGTLHWALESNQQAGEALVESQIALIWGCGGFRPSSPNYVGEHAIADAVTAFRAEGYEVSLDSNLRPIILDSLSGAALTEALRAYVRRAKAGTADAALLTGTGKDLLEATAAHILVERNGSYPQTNFQGLLGASFRSFGNDNAASSGRAWRGSAEKDRARNVRPRMRCEFTQEQGWRRARAALAAKCERC